MIHARFDTYVIEVPVGLGQADSSLNLRDLSSKQLSALLRERSVQGTPVHEIESERELRHALALAPLALGILGIPIGMVLEKGGRTMGFGASAGLLFLYYLVLVLGLSLAEKGTFPGGLSVWAANVLCVGVGASLLYRTLKK